MEERNHFPIVALLIDRLKVLIIVDHAATVQLTMFKSHQLLLVNDEEEEKSVNTIK